MINSKQGERRLQIVIISDWMNNNSFSFVQSEIVRRNKHMMKYHINNKIFNTYGVTPQLCVLDTIHFFEFNSKRSEDANFICFASNKAIVEMVLKKAEAYGIPLTLKQAKNCLANCQQNGKLIKVPNFLNGDDEPLCPLTTNKYVWMTKIRADMSDEELARLRNKKSRIAFEQRRPELVGIRDRLTEYLKYHNISVIGKERQIEAQLEKVENSLNCLPMDRIKILDEYLNFLESGEYQFQLKKNKYAPRMTKLTDVSGKFDAIRNFHRNRSSWFDPSKHLSETFNK